MLDQFHLSRRQKYRSNCKYKLKRRHCLKSRTVPAESHRIKILELRKKCMESDVLNGNNGDAANNSIPTIVVDDKKTTKKSLFQKMIFMNFVRRAALVILGYIICYMQWSILLSTILIGGLGWLEYQDAEKRKKIATKYKASGLNRGDMSNILKEIPPWVTFPDWERADWLNEIILQLWPSLNNYFIKVFRNKIQKNIRKKYESFTFEDIDFGYIPPRIDGVKVYNKSVTKDSIIIDFDVLYDGDCDIKCSVSGTQIGSIKDFQLGVEVRVILKPILAKLPLLGGIQIFFLNTPDINFDLEGLSGLTGLSYFIRQKIEERITKLIVFPNKITRRFTKSVEAAELKSLEPEGVLRVHVFEAKDLEKKDITGKSDPYVVLKIGAQSFKTEVISRSLNPKWDFWCEFIVLDPEAQQLYFTLYDEDVNKDDFLGSGFVDIVSVMKGQTDQWFDLERVKHGKLHLRFTWFGLNANYESLNAAKHEARLLKVKNLSTGLLTIFVDSAQNLPRGKSYKKPDPFCTISVANNALVQKTRTKKHTIDPIWEQGFSFLVTSPDEDNLCINVIDKDSDEVLLEFDYNLTDLQKKENLQISKEVFDIEIDEEITKLTLSLQLRILTNERFNDEEVGSDSDSDYQVSRKNSNASSASVSRQISLDDEDVEELARKVSAAATQAVLKSPSLSKLGQIDLSLHYSNLRQKLIVKVHRIRNLLQKSAHDIPDPYVKLKLFSTESTSTSNTIHHKTKVVIDNCNPIYDEEFECLLSAVDLPKHKLLFTVKTKRLFSNKNVIGEVLIDLKSCMIVDETLRAWFDLCPQTQD